MLLGMALLGLVLLGLGGWFDFAYFASTDAAIRHAEAFLFRRMKVAQLGEQGAYRFFYVTNRHLEPGEGALEERFGAEREERVKFGLFDAAVEPSLGIGMIIDPTAWFQNEEIKLREVLDLLPAFESAGEGNLSKPRGRSAPCIPTKSVIVWRPRRSSNG